MPRVLKLSDDKIETLFDDWDFEWLIDKYMGYEAARYFRELMNEVEDEKEEVRSMRSDITDQTLDLISKINLVDEDDREEIAEEFRAIMEDLFGLEG